MQRRIIVCAQLYRERRIILSPCKWDEFHTPRIPPKTHEGANGASRCVSGCSDTDKSPSMDHYLNRYMLTARCPTLKALRDETYDEDERERVSRNGRGWRGGRGEEEGRDETRPDEWIAGVCCLELCFLAPRSGARASTRWVHQPWPAANVRFASISLFVPSFVFYPLVRKGRRRGWTINVPASCRKSWLTHPRQGRPLPVWPERGQIRLRRYEFEIP